MNKSNIEWCDYTWNPVTGCLHGCTYCYARRIAERFAAKAYTENKDIFSKDFKSDCFIPIINNGKTEPYPYGFKPTFHRYRLEEPTKKSKSQKIFVCSMADLFGDWVPDEWINDVMISMTKAPHHTYMLLTKNPNRYYDYLEGAWQEIDEQYDFSKVEMLLGTTVTKQEDLNQIFPNVLTMLDFLSIEPLLEEIDLEDYLYDGYSQTDWTMKWVIIGAQTGPGSVQPKKEWVNKIINQCREVNIPVFLKDNLKWPEKIQEFPEEV